MILPTTNSGAKKIMCPTPSSSLVVDDDRSMDSTLSSSAPFKCQSSKSINTITTTSSSVRVRFDEAVNIYHDNSYREHDDSYPETWYSAADYQSFKRSAIQSVKKMLTSEDAKASCQIIEHVFQKICQTTRAPSYPHDNTEGCSTRSVENQKFRRDDREEEEKQGSDIGSLGEVYKCHLEFIGLESYAVHRLKQDKRSRRIEVVDAVLAAQEHILLLPHQHPQRQQLGGSVNCSSSSLTLPHSQHINQAILREFCERLSSPSRQWAHHLAVAQHATVARGDT